ncbi:tumor necrosis factor receptor superfamily member 18 [Oenanthe melanoleuca]|uniref:tumor necrosis factor receptor superfamily member 18 n=1 Tax=Oenanthe melanoleuca TaxID=2939378 RepID=UPI0024C155B5|nr:tumor necrosis factor receptor superfamily member 18 [Oenanthe melanoleuca]
MCQPRLWLLLALLAGQWPRRGRAGPCQDGLEPRQLWGGGTKCCPHCTWRAGDASPCQAEDNDCKCPEGFGCSDKPCHFCQSLPRCEPGWEPHRIGTENFQFECKPCENGSYSSSRNSQCHNWTDCESSGYVTLRAGNSTHNSVCSLPVGPLERAWIPLEFPSSTILAILTAVAVFVLILLTFLLHFCIWSLRRDKKLPAADLGLSFPRPLPLQGEESHSIQFPEEEHGDKTAEEKNSSLSLKVYSELR